MSERIDRTGRSIDLARRIAEGELSETEGAIAILEFVHDCSNETMDTLIANMRRAA